MTGATAYYKNGTPYTHDGQVVIVITCKTPTESGPGGDSPTSSGVASGSGAASGSGGDKLDLSYAAYRATISNSIKQLENTLNVQRARTEEFAAQMQREKTKRDNLTNYLKDVVTVKHPVVTALAHQNNRELEAFSRWQGQARAEKQVRDEAEAAKKSFEQEKCKLNETERQLKLAQEETKRLAALSNESRTIEIAKKNLTIAKSELAKVNADIQSKHAVVARLSGEVKEAQKRADSKPRGFSGWTNVQSKLDRQLKGKKDEYTAAEKSLNVATNNRTDKVKKITEAEKILKLATDNLINPQIKSAVDTTVTSWKSLPLNSSSIDITVDGFVYSVTLNNYGNVTSTVKIKDRPYTKSEIIKVNIAKEQNKKPGDLYPELNFSKNDPQRKSQAEKNAQDLFSSFPTNPISIASDFYKSLADKFGDRFSGKAKSLAIESKGKKIRSAAEAIAAFDKYKIVLNKKFSVTDRVAIAKALESIDKQMMAAQLKKFGKMFGIIGESLQWGQFLAGIVKGLRTGEWEDAIISGEKIAVGKIAAFAAVVAFSSIAVSPVGIIGFSFIMATTSALISDDMLKDMNNFILSI